MVDKMTGSDALSIIQEYAGKSVVRVSRLFYLFKGSLDRDEGELEIEFSDGSVLFLEGDATGELLRISTARWRDPYSGPLSSENEEYIREYGRSVMTDVSDEPEYREIIGRTLDCAYPLTNRFGSVIGTQLEFGSCLLNFYVCCDDCMVTSEIERMHRWTEPPS